MPLKSRMCTAGVFQGLSNMMNSFYLKHYIWLRSQY